MPSKKAAAMTKSQKKGKKQQKAPPPKPVESGSEDDSEEEEEMDESPAPVKNAQKRKAGKAQVKTSKKAKKPTPPKESSDEEEVSDEEVEESNEEVEAEESDKEEAEESEAEEEDEEEDAEESDEAEEAEEKEAEEEEAEEEESEDEAGTKPAAKTGDDIGTTMFVKNLPTNIKKDKLMSLLQHEFTESVIIRIPGSQDQVKGYAFVEFESSAEVVNAIKKGAKLGGKSLFLEGTLIKSSKPIGAPGGKVKHDDTLLFVKNLPPGFDEDEMKSLLMEHFSNPKEIRLPSKPGGELKGFGFLKFLSSADVKTALEKLQGSDLKGSSLFLNRSGKNPDGSGDGGRGKGSSGGKTPRAAPAISKTLFVKNLSFSTDIDSLKKAFDGAVDAAIPVYKDSGHSRGFGYVEYDSTDAAQKAREEMKNFTLDGRELSVDYAHGRTDSPREAGGGRSRGGGRGRGRGGGRGRGRGGGRGR